MTDPNVGDEPPDIVLTVPARASYARLARLAVAALASRLGCSYDEIEDLRVAVGEAFNLLVDDDDRVVVRCDVVPQAMTVELSGEAGGPLMKVTDLTRQILDAVTDGVDIDDEDARVRLLKRWQD